MGKVLAGVGTGSVSVTVGGVDLTDHVKSITINQAYDKVDITPMGVISKQYSPGLRDDSIDIEFFQDWAASSVDQTLYPLLGNNTGTTLIIQTSGTTVSTTQPKYTMVSCIYTYTPFDGEVGAALMNKVSFSPAAGATITRATS